MLHDYMFTHCYHGCKRTLMPGKTRNIDMWKLRSFEKLKHNQDCSAFNTCSVYTDIHFKMLCSKDICSPPFMITLYISTHV